MVRSAVSGPDPTTPVRRGGLGGAPTLPRPGAVLPAGVPLRVAAVRRREEPRAHWGPGSRRVLWRQSGAQRRGAEGPALVPRVRASGGPEGFFVEGVGVRSGEERRGWEWEVPVLGPGPGVSEEARTRVFLSLDPRPVPTGPSPPGRRGQTTAGYRRRGGDNPAAVRVARERGCATEGSVCGGSGGESSLCPRFVSLSPDVSATRPNRCEFGPSRRQIRRGRKGR